MSVWDTTHLSAWETQRKVVFFLREPSVLGTNVQRSELEIHPKTLFEIDVALLTISVSFPSKSRFSANFSILLRFVKNNVRNCDLLQSDFFARVGPS